MGDIDPEDVKKAAKAAARREAAREHELADALRDWIDETDPKDDMR